MNFHFTCKSIDAAKHEGMNKGVHTRNITRRRRMTASRPLFLYAQITRATISQCSNDASNFLDSTTFLISMLIGTAGGFLGGLFGIGGGLVIIPLLTLAQGSNPHLYQASSLVAALLVSAGSIPRHIRAKAIRWVFALRTIPLSLASVAIGIGIAIGNSLENPLWLERIFAVFLAYVAITELVRRVRSPAAESAHTTPTERVGWGPACLVGGAMGTLAGLLGIGGGVIAVPMMRVVNRFDIRTTIATSAFLILPTVMLGIILKYSTLSSVKTPSGDSIAIGSALWLAVALAPGAFFGAVVGASLVHKLPMKQLAIAFGVLCGILAIRMAGFGAPN